MENEKQLDYIMELVVMSLYKTKNTIEQLEKLSSEISEKISDQKESIRTLEMATFKLNQLREETKNEKNQCK
jgi:hypothetical protein|nr:MAG TPA: hypothetical protein [Caudoviricetes sp.]